MAEKPVVFTSKPTIIAPRPTSTPARMPDFMPTPYDAMQVVRGLDRATSRYSGSFDAPMSTSTREAPMVDEERNDPHGPSDLPPSRTADHGSR